MRHYAGLDKMLWIGGMDVLWSSVLFVCRLLRGFFRRWFVENLDLISNTHFLANWNDEMKMERGDKHQTAISQRARPYLYS
jgi:hypothetical protein